MRNGYPCLISQVLVDESTVTIIGDCAGEGEFSLGEIPPYLDLMNAPDVLYKTEIVDLPFRIVFDRWVERNGYLYDRLLSKWVIYKKDTGKDQLASHAHYADEIHPIQSLSPINLTSKKGLGGIIPNQYISDLTSLNISSATINVCITHFMHSTPRAGDIEHTYGRMTYYMDENYLSVMLLHWTSWQKDIAKLTCV